MKTIQFSHDNIFKAVFTKNSFASKKALSDHISRDDRARLLSEWKYIVDTQNMRVSAKRKGLKEGREKGLAEGRVQGQQEAAMAIARKMKEMGDSTERIQTITGLSIEDIVSS
jgi:flagellar biosynthesis/type III secretory pathway protein FliH